MRLPRVSGSTVAVALAGIALFVSLGGPAWAASALIGTKQLRNNAITSKKIAKGAVRNSDLGKGSVTGSKLAAGSVTSTKLGARAVTGAKLAAGSVGNGTLVNGLVTNGKLGDGSVSNGKLAQGSVSNGKLGGNAVTSSKVQDGSLTAGDLAPNTFLPANGTATNANALGGFDASSYATSDSGRVTVASGGAAQTLLVVSTGTYLASCPAATPTVTYQNASTAVDFAEQDATSGGAFHFTTLNAINGGTATTVASANGNPFTSTIQTAAKTDSRVATAWVNGHVEGGSCIVTGQAISGR